MRLEDDVNLGDLLGLWLVTVPAFSPPGAVNGALCQEDLANSRLIRLLPGWATPPVQVSAYYPRRLLEPRKVKLFLDCLIEWFAKPKRL